MQSKCFLFFMLMCVCVSLSIYIYIYVCVCLYVCNANSHAHTHSERDYVLVLYGFFNYYVFYSIYRLLTYTIFECQQRIQVYIYSSK